LFSTGYRYKKSPTPPDSLPGFVGRQTCGQGKLNNEAASTDNTSFSVDEGNDGNYKWLVEYSGDDSHNAATSACGKEAFTATIDNDTTN
jgi:hypothetical protein